MNDDLEKKIKALEDNQIKVIMSNNADQNVFRSIQRTLQGNINLGTGSFVMGVSPRANQSAMIEMITTTKGFLPPRMTTTQRDAITSPATGLIIYNITTNKINFYDGGAWRVVTST